MNKGELSKIALLVIFAAFVISAAVFISSTVYAELVKKENPKLIYNDPDDVQFTLNADNSYNIMADYSASFANTSDKERQVKIAKNGYIFEFDISRSQASWFNSVSGQIGATLEPLNKNLAKIGNKLTYNNAWNNTNLTYEIERDRIKEDIILGSAPDNAGGNDFFRFKMNVWYNSSMYILVNNISYLHPSNVNVNTTGAILLRSLNNNTVFEIPKPIITDANGATYNATFFVNLNDGSDVWYIGVHKNVINSAQFPLTIDPTVIVALGGTPYNYFQGTRILRTSNNGIWVAVKETDNSLNLYNSTDGTSWSSAVEVRSSIGEMHHVSMETNGTNIYIAYHNSDDAKVYFKTYNTVNRTLSSEIQISPVAAGYQIIETAINSTGAFFVSYTVSSGPTLYVNWTTDGVTFSAVPVDSAVTGVDFHSLSVDLNNNLHILFAQYANPNAAIWYFNSSPPYTAWTKTDAVTSIGDDEQPIVDGLVDIAGNVHVFATKQAPAEIHYTRRNVTQSSFESLRRLVSEDGYDYPRAAIDSQGTIFLFYDNNSQVRYINLSNGSSTWSAPTNVTLTGKDVGTKNAMFFSSGYANTTKIDFIYINNTNDLIYDRLNITPDPPTPTIQVPNLSSPANNSILGALPEFKWSNIANADNYTIDVSNETDFTPLQYSSNLTTNVTNVTGLPSNVTRYYYWRVTARNSSIGTATSLTFNFTYSQWNITFNITGSDVGEPHLNNTNITSCTHSGFNQGGDTSNYYGPYAFPNGTWSCLFSRGTYYPKTQIFNSDSDKIVNVIMPLEGGATFQEHTWLEAIYNCVTYKDCALFDSLYDILIDINQTVNNTWQHIKPTDTSVVRSEAIVGANLSSSSNITINYTVYVPIKAGYTLGTYLPIRIGFWFLNQTNGSCYSQGTLPTGVTVIEPYCNPLMVQTLGPMGSNTSFQVNLRPNLPNGTYNLTRIIEIDPNNVWIGYGQGQIGSINVQESNSNSESGVISFAEPIETTQPEIPNTQQGPITGKVIAIGYEDALKASLIIIIILAVAVVYFYSKRKK